MSKTIAISNHKGGVGKTTSTHNIGAGLVLLGKKVLLIDLDPQSHLTDSAGIKEPENTIYDVLKGDDLPIINIYKNLDLIPANLDLSGIDIELSTEIGREMILKKQLDAIKDNYDFILIDCPPSLNLLTVNAFTAANIVFIPLQAEYLAFKGLSRLIDIIEKVREALNNKLYVGGVIPTRFDIRKVLNRNIIDVSENYFKGKVFETRIRENIALAEAPSEGLDIFQYAPKSNGAEDYMSLCKEILKRLD